MKMKVMKSNDQRSFCLIAVFLLTVSCILDFNQVASTRLEHQCFLPPFETVNHKGTRIINDNWAKSGSTTVNSKFVRLTPDRQSKKGAIWNKKALAVNEFTGVLKFRISGQGERFFGDGMGLWVTTSESHFDGPIHGNEEKFYGVGIIFDTFKNTENLEAHRDVLVLINDGTKTQEEMIGDAKSVQGCFGNLRYHEKRADFSVTDSSRAKIILKDNYLKIQIDAQNTGKWVDCVEIKDLNLTKKPEWLGGAHVGITASTGQLADNHDVISFEAYSDGRLMERDEVQRMRKKDIAFYAKHGTTEEKLKNLGTAMKDLLDRINTVEHEEEHNSLAINDELKSLLSKLEKKSNGNDEKVEELENKIKDLAEKHLNGAVADRLEGVQNAVNGNIDRKILNVDNKFQKAMKKKHEDLTKEHQTRMGTWKLPFLLLVVVVIGALIAMYMFYIKIKKTHLL